MHLRAPLGLARAQPHARPPGQAPLPEGSDARGYTAAEDYADTGAVVVSDRDLFSDDSVMLHGMKVFAEKRIDEAILDAASVIISCGGIMSGIFLNMSAATAGCSKRSTASCTRTGWAFRRGWTASGC